MPIVFADELRAVVSAIFVRRGVPARDANIVADCLVHADLRGVESHGVMRVAHYCQRLAAGSIVPDAVPAVERTAAAVANVDGRDGLGHVAVHRAMEEAIAMAEDAGLAFVHVRHSSHCGALSFYGTQAIAAGKIGLAMTQTDPAVVAFGGTKPFSGTNPLCLAVPTERGAPIVLDMATSTVAGGHVMKARAENRPIPAHWAVDIDGKPTTDPHAVKYLTPAGGAKGFGLGVLIDLFTGVLGGANFGPHVVTMYGDYEKRRDLCHLVGAIDPARFPGAGDFLSRAADVVDELNAIPPAEGFSQVMAPGEPEWRREQERRAHGIPLPDYLWEELQRL